MKRLLFFCVFVGFSVLAVSCLDNFEQQHTGGNSPTIPFDFDWNTTRDVVLTVDAPVVEDETPEFALINVYSSAVLSEKNLIAQGSVNRTRTTFRTAFTLPLGVESVYVQTIIPDGSRAAKMVPVTASSLHVSAMRITPVPSAERRALAAELIARAVGDLVVTSLEIPVTEPVPASYDVTIDQTPAQKLYIGGDASKSTYLIPAGVVVDGNIELVGWTNNLPTLYVAGRLELKGMTTVEKTRLVVLPGGVVVLEGGLTINNSFVDKASVYVFEEAKLTVQSLTFASGNGGLMANLGGLNIKGGEIKMSNGRLYTLSGLNPDMRSVKIDVLQASVSAQIHNDGIWNGGRLNMDSSSEFTNYENGTVTLEDAKLDDMTLNQRGILKAGHVKCTNGVAIINVCRTTVVNLEAESNTVINLASGSLFSVINDGVFHTSTVNLAAMSMLDIHKLDKKSYVSRFVAPSVSDGSDGAQAVIFIDESDYKDNRNPMTVTGLVEVVSNDPDGLRFENGATHVDRQTVNIPATQCNGGRGEITPTPQKPTDEFEVKGAVYTYCFEDGWPWCGDYDMNDLVVVASVDRKVKNGNVEAIRINWEARASGADNYLAFAVCLDKVLTTNVASVAATHRVGEGVFTVENGMERDNDYAVIPFFNKVSEVLGVDNGFANTVSDMPKVAIQKYSTTITFSSAVAPEVVIESALNFFLVATRSNATEYERWREIHLASYQPTKHAVITGFNTVIESMPYKYYAQGGELTNNGLMWGLRIPGEFRYLSERNDIRTVYTEFMSWASGGGTTNAKWYEGDVVSDKLYR